MGGDITISNGRINGHWNSKVTSAMILDGEIVNVDVAAGSSDSRDKDISEFWCSEYINHRDNRRF